MWASVPYSRLKYIHFPKLAVCSNFLNFFLHAFYIFPLFFAGRVCPHSIASEALTPPQSFPIPQLVS